jgi:addiction module HigA family antidote
MPMKNPPHPGLSVRHDCLEPLGLSVTEAARKLGVSRKQLSDIVNARSGISPEMAIRLDKAFGGGADTWLRLRRPTTSPGPCGTPTGSRSSG